MVTVMPYEKVLRYRKGRLDRVLEPGKHRAFGLGIRNVWVSTRLRVIDVRPQEIPTADGITVKVSAGLHARVSDPQAWHEIAENPEGIVYDAAKTALRDIVRELSLEQAATGIAVVVIPEVIAAAALSVGVEVVKFEIRDIVVPADIRRANDELIASRQQSQIALERARSEVAVLRALANSAKVLEDHPVLASLRLAETVGDHGGTVVIERPHS